MRARIDLAQLREALASGASHVDLELSPAADPGAASYAIARSEPLRPVLQDLAGQGLSNRAIAHELNDRMLLGPSGGLWQSTSIRRLRARLGV